MMVRIYSDKEIEKIKNEAYDEGYIYGREIGENTGYHEGYRDGYAVGEDYGMCKATWED